MINLSNISEYALREFKATSVEWEEDKHPREQNGRFAPKGIASSNSSGTTNTNQKPHNSTIHHESNHKQRSSISELQKSV